MKRNTLRVTALIAAGSLALVASGCAAGGQSNDAAESKGAVAMSFGGLDIQIWNDMLEAMKPIVEDAGYEFLSDDPQWDLQTQIADWESWIARGDVAAIMGYPVQSDSMVAVTAQAQDAGVTVLGYASEWEGTTAAVKIDNRNDGIALGEAIGEWMLENDAAAGPEPVALLGYWDTDLGRERSEGIVEGLENSGAEFSLTEHSVINLDDGYQAAQNQLAAEPETKVWISMGNDPALGAYQALLDAGVDPEAEDYALGNLDSTNEILDIVANEKSFWRVLFSLRVIDLATPMAQMLIDAAEGKPLTDVMLKSERVTPENIDTFYL